MPEIVLRCLAVLLPGFVSLSLHASEPIKIAVAANFVPALKHLAKDYEALTGQGFLISSGSSGKLYAQIIQGAPYDLFFSADAVRPKRLEEEGYVSGSRRTYVLGRLALWQKDNSQPVSLEALGKDSGRIAIANPKLAPYGVAAQTVLEEVSLWDVVVSRLVMGENVSQVFQYASTGQVGWAFMPLSQVRLMPAMPGRVLELSRDQYPPIRQQAVVLNSGNKGPARAFLEYCMSADARAYLEQAGYALPDEDE